MAYGGGGRRVPIVHGERMRDALRQQGTPVDGSCTRDGRHGLRREVNRYDFYARVKTFLATHLK